MLLDKFSIYAPEPYADAGLCGACSACAALRRRPAQFCGCPQGWTSCSTTGASTSDSPSFAPARPQGPGPASPSCLHALGRQLSHALFFKAPLERLPLLKATHVLGQAIAVANRAARSKATSVDSLDVSAAGLTFHQALVLVTSHLQHLVRTGDLSSRTVQKMAGDMAAMSRYMTAGRQQPLVAEASATHLRDWIEAPLAGHRRNGQEAAATTRRLRRSAARLFFKVLRRLGLHDGDPTLDIPVPPAESTSTVPLEDEELLLLRYACVIQANDTRLPSVLALAEATATTGEIARVRISDINVQEGWVDLRGN
ncbi:type II toxin-antitoxin system VapC family toxin, partial [Salmonella enterica subsp. enterica serovar Saintpaul]|nr:type II toxin-antitoxin system VapC family toxin [Salmonella enterica subsp. enterica serovar Saintpaul]